jgi:flavin-dependent dehydrogenase
LEQSDADVIRASVRGRQGHIVATTQGEFEAKVLIDASGWRAALATDSRQSREESSGRSFGLETSLQLKADGLHFYYDPSRLGYHMVGWMFPAGPTARIGLGSYRGCSRLGRPLQQFVLSHFGRDPADEHGGYFPSRRRPTMTGDVFRVGDAAGHCLPLTGEGIRPALFFGTMLGRLVQGFLAGDQTQAEAGRRYRSLVARHFWLYSCLLAAQRVLPALPLAGIKVVADVVRRPANLDWLFGTYGNAFDPVEVSWWRDTKADRRPRPRLAA